jgi:hypothetical protein
VIPEYLRGGPLRLSSTAGSLVEVLDFGPVRVVINPFAGVSASAAGPGGFPTIVWHGPRAAITRVLLDCAEQAIDRWLRSADPGRDAAVRELEDLVRFPLEELLDAVRTAAGSEHGSYTHLSQPKKETEWQTYV